MSVAAPPRAAADGELSALYGRYKALALSAAAAVIFELPLDGVRAEVERLLEDCRVAGRLVRAHEAQFAACAEAASVLRDVLLRAPDGEMETADLEMVRASHRELRRSVWRVVPCEYVPCCADDHHIHRS
jgi:hypothetical protein